MFGLSRSNSNLKMQAGRRRGWLFRYEFKGGLDVRRRRRRRRREVWIIEMGLRVMPGRQQQRWLAR